MATEHSKSNTINKLGIRIILILLIPIVILSTILIFESRTLNYGNVSKELKNTFGEGMVLGVHDMGEGLISSVVFIDGSTRNEKTYLKAMVKLRDFAKKISKYHVKDIHEIGLTIGLKHSISNNDIIFHAAINTNTLKTIDWESIDSYEKLSEYFKIDLE
mgnify:CR=1 FL=1